jgi:ParB-like chromosome segregation protein Spo0J
MSEVEKEKVGEWIHVDQLTEWDKNPRFNDQAVDQIAESIKKFGFASPIIARTEDNRIIAGHTRYKAAKQLNIQYVPVRFMDLSEKEADALALADNRLGEISSWDDGLLGDILAELDNGDFDIDVVGFSQQEIDQLMGNWTDPFFDDDDEDLDVSNESDEIEDNGTTMITLTVPVYKAKDVCDMVVDLLDNQDIEHTIKMK